MDLVDHPDNPIPAGTVSGEVTTSDGRRIRYARFPANASPRRGTVTILQGRAEFIEKYFETIEDLRARGFAVVAFDWRGQGGSQRLLAAQRGYVDSFEEYVRDAVAVLEQVTLPDCPGPHYGLAHSTGGAVALLGHVRLRTLFERMVLASPLIGFGTIGPSQRLVGTLAGALTVLGLAELPLAPARLSTYGAEDFDNNQLTSDRVRFDRLDALLRAAPALATGPVTIGWINAAVRTMRRITATDFAPRVSLPLLIVAAGADTVVSTRASEELASRMRAAGYVEIPGARHELMMEADRFREQFWAAFDAFIPGAG